MVAETQALSAEGMFKDFERDGFHLRDPAVESELSGLQRGSAIGACLNPLIVAGDELYIEPTEDIRHGDLVLVKWAPEIVEAWQASGKRQWQNGQFSPSVAYWVLAALALLWILT